jgi:predicted nucleic acid-binding protein
MGNRIFLDTNIILDFIIPNRKYSKEAIMTLKKATDRGYEIYISEDMISTVYYVAKDYKKESINFFKDALKYWQIVPFGANVLNQAFDFALKNGLDLEDTLQCFCAKENGCELFLTSDKKFVDCGIKTISYKDFLEK